MHLKLYMKRLYLGIQSDTYFSMKKGYHDYTPIVKEEVKVESKKGCPFTGIVHPEETKFVKDDIFKLMFGYEYPKIYPKQSVVQTIKYPKTDGSNGKVSRFR